MTSNETLSALMSLLALGSSLWLWAQQRRREGPHLQPWWDGEPPRWHGCCPTQDEDTWCVLFETNLLIANLSALPDALLDVRCRVKAKEAGWLPLVVQPLAPHQDAEPPALPLDLPPRQVVDRRMGFGVNLPKGVADNPSLFLVQPLQIEVELIGLGERCHRGLIVAA